jgi:hypothetical protein
VDFPVPFLAIKPMRGARFAASIPAHGDLSREAKLEGWTEEVIDRWNKGESHILIYSPISAPFKRLLEKKRGWLKQTHRAFTADSHFSEQLPPSIRLIKGVAEQQSRTQGIGEGASPHMANQMIIFKFSSSRYSALYPMGIFCISTMIIPKRKCGSFLQCDPNVLAEHIGNV